MTEEAKRCVYWLRTLEEGKGFASYLIGAPEQAKEAADLIESMSKQLDDQTVVIDRIYEQCKTLQNDLKELGFDSIADMYAQLEQVEKERDGLNIMLTQTQAMLETRTKERDAAVTDLWNMCSCKKCKHVGSEDMKGSKCIDCWLRTVPGHPELSHRTNWQWRGVREAVENAEKAPDGTDE